MLPVVGSSGIMELKAQLPAGVWGRKRAQLTGRLLRLVLGVYGII